MQPNWIPTDKFYHQILETPDAVKRRQLFLELIVEPWKPMMAMVQGRNGIQTSDELAGARTWKWLLPDQTDKIEKLLAQMEGADAWGMGKAALAKAVAAFTPWHTQLGIDAITGWLLLADSSPTDPADLGYTGATDWMNPRFVCQYWHPTEHNLARIGTVVTHEMHHLIRLRAHPWDMMRTTVADYIVLEGSAESFATSLFGEDKVGRFVSDLSDGEVECARQLIGEGLDKTGFNVIRSYIFGDALAEQSGFAPLGGMPTYGGYAVGYRVVQAFLQRSGKSIEETTFLSAKEIIAGSGYF